MRCASNCRDLSIISCSWNAKDLRASLGGGQGKIYLRPIQKSLSTQPLVEQSQCEVKEKCYMCNQDVLVRKLREHLWSCTEGLDSDDDNRTSDNATTTNDSASTSLATNSAESSNNAGPIATTLPYSNATLSSPSLISSDPPSASQRSSSDLPSASNVPTVDLTQTPAAEENHTGQTVDEVVSGTVAFCEENSVVSHVEILRCFQQKMVIGRALEVQNVAQATEGETNYINVDRHNLMETSFEEIMFLGEYRRTLEVQFYGEVCTNVGKHS